MNDYHDYDGIETTECKQQSCHRTIYTHGPIYTYRDNSHLPIKDALSSHHHRTFVGIKYFIILCMFSEHSATIVSVAPFSVEHMYIVEIIGHCYKSEAL